MATFFPNHSIVGLVGAEYNPRKIEAEGLDALERSLTRLGVGKPIICSGKVIIAGHQRTRTLRRMGRTEGPVIQLKQIAVEDEIRMNQLHNGCDFDSGDEDANVGPAGCEPFHFEDVPYRQATGNMRARMANVRGEISKLLIRYGNWGACIATMDGTVVHAGQYVLACRALGLPIRTYRLPDEMEDEARELLGKKFGVFSYDHLERKTYIQTYAQMMRLRPSDSGKTNQSTLYETRVMPTLKRDDRILDFGCGQGDYVRSLRALGHRVFGVEFFFRSGKVIDAGAVHRMIDEMIDDVRRNGLYDVVVCDSVLNSVDTIQAQDDVLTCINALCRPGGHIWFSGRKIERTTDLDRLTKVTGPTRYVEFIDEKGFTSLYRNGNWFYQLFHDRAQAEALALQFVGPDAVSYQSSSTSWSTGGLKSVEFPAEVARASLKREFDLIWPGGRTVDRARPLLAAWETARSG